MKKHRLHHIPPLRRGTLAGQLATLLQLVASLLAIGTPGLALAQANCGGWEPILLRGPVERSRHTMAYDSVREVVVLFGGVQRHLPQLGDTWEWDGDRWQLRALDGPPARERAAMAFDSRRGVTVLFGGEADGLGDLGDTWEWDGSTWSHVSDSGPDPRAQSAMAYDSRRGVVVLFSGLGQPSDTWEWDGQRWTRIQITGPPPRFGHTLAYDSERGVVVLFGGVSASADTWEYDGVSWTHVASEGPARRYWHTMAYDTVRQVCVLYGGALVPIPEESYTWEWNGVNWVQSETQGIESDPRISSATAFDTARGELILFGGEVRSRSTGDLWRYRGHHAFTEQPQAQAVLAGTPVEFRVRVRQPESATYQWLLDGRRLRDYGPLSGAQTDTLNIDGAPVILTGAYRCIIRRPGCAHQVSIPARLTVIAPRISIDAACPGGGRSTFSWNNCTPHGRMSVLVADGPGTFTIPRGYPCDGTVLGLEGSSVRLAGSATSDEVGAGAVRRPFTAHLCGKVIQLIDEASCAVSNVAIIE